MIQILTRNFPFGTFKAMAVWPFIFLKGAFTETDVRHEEIHGAQQMEMLPLAVVIAVVLAAVGYGWWSLLALPLFYWLYGLCWLIELVRCARNKQRGQVTDPRYRQRNYWNRVEHAIIFEREAYGNQHLPNYLRARRLWAWIKC